MSSVSLNGSWSGMSRSQLYAHCEAGLKQGIKKDILFSKMIGDGYPPAEASQIIYEAVGKLSGSASKVLIVGIILFVFGILMTVATYKTAYEAGGGYYLLCFGPVISGAVMSVIGLRSIIKLR